MGSLLSPQLKRLLGYVKPYRLSMSLGVVLLAVVGISEAHHRPDDQADRGQGAQSCGSRFERTAVYDTEWWPVDLSEPFFPHSIHNVWAVVAISLLVVFFVKSLAEFGGSTLIQFVGHRAITDLRNALYEKIIRLPIGFFQQQPTGRVMSAVINDVERARPALSEYLADMFRQSIHVCGVSGCAVEYRLENDTGVRISACRWCYGPLRASGGESGVPWKAARANWVN